MTTQRKILTSEQNAALIAQALRHIRTSVGLTQTELSRRGGPDFRTISQWEGGRRQPSLLLLIRYLNVMDADLHDLQGRIDFVAGQPKQLSNRLDSIESRLLALERWRWTSKPLE